MPLSQVTCPICLATLKPAQPVAEGTRVRCPKCKGAFVAEAEPKPEEPAADDDAMEVTVADDEEEARPRRRRPVRDDEEERPRRPAKKAVTPLWVWLTGGGVVLFLLCGCCGVGLALSYSSLGLGSISAANYAKLKRGMSENDARWVLGAPTSTAGGSGGVRVDTWQDGTDFIVVTFQNDRAVSRACRIQQHGVIQIQDSGILPW